MPAPKTPNTSPARDVRAANVQRRKHQAAAATLHAAGWFLAAPEQAADVRMALESVGRYEEDWTDREWKPASAESGTPDGTR